MFGAISGGGAAIGLIVGGVLTEYASWRWCLGVNMPIALIAAAFAVYDRAREQGRRATPATTSPARCSRRWAWSHWSTASPKRPRPKHPSNPNDTAVQGWTAPSTITFLIVAVILLVAFVLWEQRTTNPLLPLRIVLDRNRGGSYLMFLLVGAGLFAMFLFLTYYFQINLGYSPLKAGLRVPAVQRRHHRRGRRRGPAAAAGRPAAADDPRPGAGGRRHAAADPDRRRTRRT